MTKREFHEKYGDKKTEIDGEEWSGADLLGAAEAAAAGDPNDDAYYVLILDDDFSDD